MELIAYNIGVGICDLQTFERNFDWLANHINTHFRNHLVIEEEDGDELID